MNNVNYRALCDETLTVGAQTTDGLTENATKIWRQALEGIIKQYGKMNTTYSYAVVLCDSEGAHLPLALTIKNGTTFNGETLTIDDWKAMYPSAKSITETDGAIVITNK